MENEFPKRKNTRAKEFDYSSTGAYFITICTEGRLPVLARIAGGDVPVAPKIVQLLPCGKIADKYIHQLNNFYSNVRIDQYVIMPNHIHMILFVSEDGAMRTSPPTRQHSVVSRFVSTLKRFCSQEYGRSIWQRSFHDHVIRDPRDYEAHAKYVAENPTRWCFDELYTAE